MEMITTRTTRTTRITDRDHDFACDVVFLVWDRAAQGLLSFVQQDIR